MNACEAYLEYQFGPIVLHQPLGRFLPYVYEFERNHTEVIFGFKKHKSYIERFFFQSIHQSLNATVRVRET